MIATPGAGGLVNAVLRKVAAGVVERIPAGESAVLDHTRRDLVPMPDGSALRLSVDAFSEDAAAAIAEKTSHARELILHWIGAFGFKEAQRIALHDLVEAPLIVTPEAWRSREIDSIVGQRGRPSGPLRVEGLKDVGASPDFVERLAQAHRGAEATPQAASGSR